jgi:uncharacterized protein (DUF2336 family)
MAGGNLSERDVSRLLVDRSPPARIEIMAKVVADFDAGHLSDHERDLVRQILQRLAIDAEVLVREAVAWQIHNSPVLSDELARRLACDVAEVAFPILRHTTFLSDEFLIEIVGERDARKQMAIAARDEVSAAVADAIVATANVPAIERLARNPGAVLTEPTLHRTLDRFGTIDAIGEALAGRHGLPPTMVERLIHRVSEELRDELTVRYGQPSGMVERLVDRGREAATIPLLRPIGGRLRDIERLVRHLHAHDRLTPSLLFRALCGGDIAVFVAGIARRCGVGVANARTLVFDDGSLGLPAVFEQAGIPSALLDPFRSAIAVAKEMKFRCGGKHRAAFQSRVIARILSDGHADPGSPAQDLLLELFDRRAEGFLKEGIAWAADGTKGKDAAE